MTSKLDDEKWMRVALKLAKKAGERDEVPVGAVLVGPAGILAKGYNLREALTTPLGHAEAMTLHRAAKRLGNWRLEETTLYVTLEPCLMCAGAMLQARIKRVVYGASDPKGGAVDSLYKTFQDRRLNHQIKVSSGVLENECAEVLQTFFQRRRSEIKSERDQKVYRRRANAIVIHKNRILGFHAIDPSSQVKYFFLPGGLIENGESAREAAIRETLEETGYRISLIPDQELVRRYDFDWNGKTIPCETTYYVGRLAEEWHEPAKTQDADYNKGPAWVSIRELEKYFGYHADVLWGVQWGVKRLKI